jgi:hypothetical protein
MTAAPPPSNNRGWIAGTVAQVLAYIDRPWKVFAVVLLAMVAGFGWVAYQHSDELVEAWLTPSEVELKLADVPEALTKLSEETSADLVQIWEVDLGTNSQRFIAARRHDGERPVIPSPRRLPIIVTVSDVRALERVLEGHPVCVEVTEFGSPLARRLAERGMKRGCAIPIPPSAQKFLGVIYLAWAAPVDPSSEQVAVGAAREIAAQLVSK